MPCSICPRMSLTRVCPFFVARSDMGVAKSNPRTGVPSQRMAFSLLPRTSVARQIMKSTVLFDVFCCRPSKALLGADLFSLLPISSLIFPGVSERRNCGRISWRRVFGTSSLLGAKRCVAVFRTGDNSVLLPTFAERLLSITFDDSGKGKTVVPSTRTLRLSIARLARRIRPICPRRDCSG